MSKVSLDRNLQPHEDVTFRLEVTLFGEEVDDTFQIRVPKAPPLMSKLKGINMSAQNKIEYFTGDNKNINFTGYAIIVNKLDGNENKRKLVLRLDTNKVPGSFSVGDDVVITNATVAKLNNLPGVIVKGPNGNNRKNYLYLAVNAAPFSNSESNLSAKGKVTEIKKIVKKTNITVKLPKDFTKKLITKKSYGAPKKGNVEDIPVFAYKQFSGANKSSIKYKLMNNNSVINLKNPPSHGDVVEWRGKESVSKLFTINDENGTKVLCYVAIARYVYNGQKWEGEWLQTTSSNEVIWGQAR